jgi:hypothetical protein
MKKLILITGTGRSGTSLLSGYLKKNYSSLGIDEIEPDNSNPYGYYEDASLIKLNEEIFKKLNVLKYFPFKKDYCKIENYNYARRLIREYISNLNFVDENIIILKDPRISNIIDIWLSVLNKSKINFKIIICYRNLNDFCASYNKSVSNENEVAEKIWISRNLQIFYNLCNQNIDFEIFNYDIYKKDKNEIEKIKKYVDSSFKKNNSDKINLSNEFYNFNHDELGKKIHEYSDNKIIYDEFKKFIINSYKNFIMSDRFVRDFYTMSVKYNRSKEELLNLKKYVETLYDFNVFLKEKCKNLTEDLIGKKTIPIPYKRHANIRRFIISKGMIKQIIKKLIFYSYLQKIKKILEFKK